jgi:hypothetical protein
MAIHGGPVPRTDFAEAGERLRIPAIQHAYADLRRSAAHLLIDARRLRVAR